MPLLKEIEFKDGLLVLWEIKEDVDSLLEECSEIDFGEGFQKLKNSKRQKEWLAVRLILKHIGCQDISVNYNQNNQPTIKHSKYQHVSISHSNKLAGVLLHKNHAVGLDIESTDRDFRKVAHKFMNDEELELASKYENGLALFWCVKEAVYKAAGIPGVHFSTQIQIKKVDQSNVFADFYSEEKEKEYKIIFFNYDDQLIAYLVDSFNL